MSEASFIVTADMPAIACIAAGYPDPDRQPRLFLRTLRRRIAQQIEEEGMDLDAASAIVRVALQRVAGVFSVEEFLQRLEDEDGIPED